MKKLILTLAVLGAVSFGYAAADQAADKPAPSKEEKCCKDDKGECCKDKEHAKDCTCEKCKAAGEKKAEAKKA
jgi:uncharacterized low-complexity protein